MIEKSITGIDTSLSSATQFNWRANYDLLWLVNKCECQPLFMEWTWTHTAMNITCLCVLIQGKTRLGW
ncbi:hypothetical protein CEUSTIGMA_g9191.t1 [Chlamydomonas eustigma]|uniref:Uncharacterized protein n=1 Tax=Chlamydomonas eustigma TaxID=1157962 RepID=A0A250XFD2_9CHLO|nr:hypothetical protein CEUSTIGMA_g9191.t1 [Chlamydomonas eustigma]|eukprot:GAX81763.1 hypothetical protein CEUSTIGMA_g9191.t1 [Chlamydomonas eustigma]